MPMTATVGCFARFVKSHERSTNDDDDPDRALRSTLCPCGEGDAGLECRARCAPFARSAAARSISRAAREPEVWDEDGNHFVDFCMAWGPLTFSGHANPKVIDAVQRTVKDGLVFGTVHRHEVELSERVLSAFPYAERVRFVVSGTEAVITAVRLARAPPPVVRCC